MIYIKKLLQEKGKWKYRGNVMIRIDANHGSGTEIYIDERLKPILDKFLE